MTDVFWTPEETRSLIEAVRQRESLYNPSSVNYRNRAALHSRWKEVAEAVGDKTVFSCKERWNVLRGIYRRQLRMAERAKPPKKYPWHWADQLTFLNKYVSAAKPRVPTPPPEETSPPPPVGGPTTPLVPKEEEHFPSASLLFFDDADGVGEREDRRARKVKRRRFSEDLEAEIREYLKMKRSNEEVDPFFVAMSRDMARLSDRDKSLFKIRVQEALHDFLYEGGENRRNRI